VGIGASVFLLAVGAILTFALEAQVGFLNLDVVGWILMAAGVLGLVLTTTIWSNRRREVVTSEPADTDVATTEPTRYRRVEERRDVGPPDTL